MKNNQKNNTMKNITIQIPNMQSTHCQMRVNNAIKTIEGVTINHIESGIASISVENDMQQEEAIKAIEKAGYTIEHIESNSATEAEEETFQFKTNINCSECVAKVTPALNAAEGIDHWDVNTNSREKILSVHSIGISKQEVMDKVKDAGFQIELINS
jgi:copper chaperone CopZ